MMINFHDYFNKDEAEGDNCDIEPSSGNGSDQEVMDNVFDRSTIKNKYAINKAAKPK